MSVIAVVEFFYPAAGIHELLLTGKEGVTFITNINGNDVRLFRSARFESVAASANHFCFSVVGMDGFFHYVSPRKITLCIVIILSRKKQVNDFSPFAQIYLYNLIYKSKKQRKTTEST